MAKKLLSLLVAGFFGILFLAVSPTDTYAVTCQSYTVSPSTGDPSTSFSVEASGCNNAGEDAIFIELDVVVIAPDGFESYFTPTPAQNADNYAIHATVGGFVINNLGGAYTVALRQRQGQDFPLVISQATVTIEPPTEPTPTPSDDPNDPPPAQDAVCGSICSQGQSCGLCPDSCPAAKAIKTFPDGTSQTIWSCTPLNIQFTGICDVDGIDTAIGCIKTGNLNTFSAFFLRWGLGLSGGLAIVMLIYSALVIMTSSGDPSRVATGKELFSSTVAGIILLVFCVLVLRVIGINVLGIF